MEEVVEVGNKEPEDGSACQIGVQPSTPEPESVDSRDNDNVQQQRQQGFACERLLSVGSRSDHRSIPQRHVSDANDTSRRSPDAKKSFSSSPNSRRVLPTTPSTSTLPSPRSPKPDDGDTDSLMKKFRYDTLKKTKKDTKKGQRNSSTFYLISSVHSAPDISALAGSEPNSSPCESPKSPKHNTLPATKKTRESPLAKNKDSPLSKSREGNLHNLYLKKRAGKTGSLPSVIAEKQTHVALYKFIPRHKDELAFTEGDPVHVTKIFDDLWYEGINITSGKQGIFPCRYVADIMADDVDSAIGDASDHKQFHLRFLGSVEVQDHKGDEILLYAIARVVNQRSMLSSANPPTCVLQVSGSGVRICNMVYGSRPPQDSLDRKNKKGKHTEDAHTGGNDTSSEESHYFSLKNVTFCGNHPKDKRYFGFITKHPDEYRFACHVMMSKYSTDPIAKIFGQCFDKFYTNFMEYRASTEDIYLE